MKEATNPDGAVQPACLVANCRAHVQQWGICDHHVRQVDAHLRELVDLHTLANHTTALLPTRTGNPAPTGAHREPPLPLNMAALDLALGEVLLMTDEADDIEDPPWTGLESWEQDWRTTLHLSPYGPATEHRATRGQTTLVGVIAFLLANWPRAAAIHPTADEFVRDVARMHARAKAALNLTTPPAWSIACPTDGCGNRLRVEHDGRDAVLRCRRCGVSRTVEHLLYVARSEGKPCWLDAEAAARALRCDVGHLGPLVRDGRLRSRGERDCRQYDVNSLRTEDVG